MLIKNIEKLSSHNRHQNYENPLKGNRSHLKFIASESISEFLIRAKKK